MNMLRSSDLDAGVRPFWRWEFASLLAMALFFLVPANADDCIQPTAGAANPVTLRSSPSSGAATRGTLSAGQKLLLVAVMPGWYETRLPDGRPAFAAKRSTDIAACPQGFGVGTASSDASYVIHVIDVGTGLAVLVRGADFDLLYDAGSNDDTARGDNNRVLAYLKTLTPAVVSLDHVVLSHPHRDHVELLPDVVRALRPRSVWDSGAFNNICGYRNFLMAIATDSSIQYHTAAHDAGPVSLPLEEKTCYGTRQENQNLTIRHAPRITDDRIQIGAGAFMTFLYANGSQVSSFNENSLVVRLDLGSRKVLLMGDAEAGGRKSPLIAPSEDSIEGKLLACCIADVKADVLIVGHHGSKTSSRTKFLDAVKANLTVVSAGPTKYATVVLPDADVVAELERRSTLFRTDLEDDACLMSPDKIGRDEDGKPGGCDNVVVKIPAQGPITASYLKDL